MKFRLSFAVSILFLLVLFVVLPSLVGAIHANQDDSHNEHHDDQHHGVKITVCHRKDHGDGYEENEYEFHDSGEAQHFNDQGKHNDDSWSSYSYDNKSYDGHGDQDVVKNHCKKPSPTPTIQPSPSPTPCVSASPSPSPSESPTPYPSESPTPTPSPSESPYPSATPEETPGPTPTPTPTPTSTPTSGDTNSGGQTGGGSSGSSSGGGSGEGQILASSTSAPGAVLGQYAATGVVEDTIMNMLGLAGAGFTLTGSVAYAKKRA